jgi:alpha-amylase/alpha-mannosidase (GH57 family)
MVRLALLWHMHQPYYEDLATGEHILPWVRLHAIKDYWGMVAMLEAFPGIRVTFNLVPSLVAQVQAFAEDRARDRHLELGLKPAADLSEDESGWVVANGFHAPFWRMIAPYPRYAELHALREQHQPFPIEALRDLQVWHKLTWMDPDLLAGDARLQSLIAKGRDFSEDDKALLRSVELELLRRVVPAYRAASERGQVELSTSPFYHPILPLLVDSDAHLRAHPGGARPSRRFSRPEDAQAHIDRAIAFHESAFGRRPLGMWPSEGSVSDEAVALMAGAGLRWLATDEDILSRSLDVPLPRDGFGHAERPDVLYRPYRIGADGPAAFFRDHALSDRVGFQYQSWDPEAAARDFVERVREAGRRFTASTGGEEGTVAVILDGENAWEHYADGGRPFLRALYRQLGEAGDIRTVTMSEAAEGATRVLPSIFPGSWIHADFYIWIGHADDHRAWTQLGDLRAAYDERAPQAAPAARDRAFEEILIAEGSDWFWWYGDDHSSDHDREFDDLFRRHLRNAYAALGAPIPEELYVSNISTGPPPDRLEPSGSELVSAPLTRPAGAMHQVAAPSLVTEVLVGFDSSALRLRISGRVAGLHLDVIVSSPAAKRVPIDGTDLAIPFDTLGAIRGADLSFGIQVNDGSGRVVESIPVGRSWTVAVPAERP